MGGEPWSITTCYALNVCVSPNSYPQCNNVRRQGLLGGDEVIRTAFIKNA